MDTTIEAIAQHDDEALAAVWLAEAKTAFAADRADEAEQRLDRVLCLNAPEQNAEARLLRAQQLVDADQVEQAIGLLREAEKAATALGSCDLMLEVGVLWARVDLRGSATRACRNALNMLDAGREGLSEREVRFLRAVAYVQLADMAQPESPAARERYLRDALDTNDPDVAPLAALKLAILRGRQGRFSEADGLLRRAVRYDHPEVSPEAAFELAAQHVFRGALGGARDLFVEVREHSGHERWSRRAHEALAGLEREVPQLPRSRVGNPADHHPRVEPLHRGKRHVIIVGAGMGGQYVLEALLDDELRRDAHRVLGFVDNFPSASGVIDQFRNLGLTKDFARTLRSRRPHEVWLAMPSAPPRVKREVATACADEFVPVKTLPIPHELLRAAPFVDQLRPVRIDDLIGPARLDWRHAGSAESATRDRVDIDRDASAWLLKKVVMIVGCGSVGSFLARAAADANADVIVLVDRSDTALRNLRKELQEGRGCSSVRVQKAASIDGGALWRAALEHDVQVLLYSAGPPSNEGVEPNRQRAVERAFKRLAHRLDDLTKLEHLVWRTVAEAPRRESIASRLAAAAERIVVGARTSSGLIKCAVRLPTTLSPTSSLIAGLEHDIERGLPVTIPAGDSTFRFVQGYRAAELMLHAATLGRDREIFGVDSGIELSMRHLATELFRLRGRGTDASRQLRVRETTEFSDAPRPSGLATPVSELIRLGGVADPEFVAPASVGVPRARRS